MLPYEGNDSWIEIALRNAHETLCQDDIPEPNTGCEFCAYRKDAANAEKWISVTGGQ